MDTIGSQRQALKLSSNLHSRALHLALSSFLERLKSHLDGTADSSLPRGPEPYRLLHDNLVPIWSQRTTLSHQWKGTYLATVVGLAVVFVGNMLAGSCVPVYPLFELLYALIALHLDLLELATSNAEITICTSLYFQALFTLRSLRADYYQPRDSLIRDYLADHEAVLLSLTEAERYRAKFLGFQVGFSTVRTLAVTVFTIGVGLFGVLRGTGIYVTLDVACSR